MATAPKCKLCGSSHWGGCSMPASRGSHGLPAVRAQAHADERMRTPGDDGMIRAACPCGCGEVVEWSPRWPSPAHRAKAYRKRTAHKKAPPATS